MGSDYAQVHLFWTIPPALFLWLTFRRLRSYRDVYKTILLIIIAVVSTTPWDNYLITTNIWTYPPSAVIGYTLFSIPFEEVFFFFIQTYITSTLYAVISRPVVHAVLLPRSRTRQRDSIVKWSGVCILLSITVISLRQIQLGGRFTYMGLILAWVTPFVALLWAVASTHILALPYFASVLPIIIPTIYLWVLDSVALQRGTWVIVEGTKLGWSFKGLEIEEAVFFLLTNVLIVFGLIASDFCLAIHDVYPSLYPLSSSSSLPSPKSILFSITSQPQEADRLDQLIDAIDMLRLKSKSFYVASFAFEGRLRLDLLALYAWCRVVDDLIDEAASTEKATSNMNIISQYLDLIYAKSPTLPSSTFLDEKLQLRVNNLISNFPSSSQSPFHLLSTLPIPRSPLDELLAGFRTDLEFTTHPSILPIKTDEDLFLYARNVASSVAELCVRLVWAHEGFGSATTLSTQEAVVISAREMGVGLQLVNIARDVAVDAEIGRIYLPGVTRETSKEELIVQRRRLLTIAEQVSEKTRPVIGMLPPSAAGGIRAACDVYLSIGEAVEQALVDGKVDIRAKVASWRRIYIAWSALG